MPDPTTFDGFRTHVSEGRYQVLAQPVVDLTTSQASHEEWLVRFDHDLDLIALLRPAELSGAIKDLDLSMMARAVLVLNADPDARAIAVNLSGKSFSMPGFDHALMACLNALTTDPARLMIELTESWDLREIDHAQSVLRRLRDRGHPVCLDDVGSGAASIRYLRAFPCDWLKIDGEFFTAALSDDRERRILDAVLSLRDGLDLRLIAEGVETPELMRFAKALGFDAGQGYALGRPQPARSPLMASCDPSESSGVASVERTG